jgi:hypothetical protein
MASSDWNADYLDLLECLHREGAEFVIVGAFALAQHGFPRATGDLDVFVRPSPENAARVLAALGRFGAPLHAAGVSASDFERPGSVYQLGVVPRRIDLLTEVSGLTFDEAWTSREERDIEGRPAPFLGYDALIKNKRASARPKDLIDVESLERRKGRR